jgi:hypothetical protein
VLVGQSVQLFFIEMGKTPKTLVVASSSSKRGELLFLQELSGYQFKSILQPDRLSPSGKTTSINFGVSSLTMPDQLLVKFFGFSSRVSFNKRASEAIIWHHLMVFGHFKLDSGFFSLKVRWKVERKMEEKRRL